jgi:hypothetical protein
MADWTEDLIETLTAFLRISGKYQMPQIRHEAVRRLSELFPAKIPTPSSAISKHRQVGLPAFKTWHYPWQLADPIDLRPEAILKIVELAWRYRLNNILPVAICWLYTWDVVTYEYLFRQRLPAKLLELLVIGHDFFIRKYPEILWDFLKPCGMLYCDAKYYNTNLCNLSSLSTRALWIPLEDIESGLCGHCKVGRREKFETCRRKLWNLLPVILVREEWKDLSDD